MEQSNNIPELGKNIFCCPHCNTVSQMQWGSSQFREDFAAIHLSLEGDKKTPYKFVQFARCYNCGGKTIWYDEEYVYPEFCPIQPTPDMPNSVLELFNEAGGIYMHSPRAACALLRLAIDRLCNELGETDRDINKNIGALVQKGLSKSVQQALDAVRVIGNKAVHPGAISLDVEDPATALALMKLINIIVTRLITEEKDIANLYNQLPESTINAIDRRDQR